MKAYFAQHSLPHCPSGRGQWVSLSVGVCVTLTSEEYPGHGFYCSELWRDGLYLCCAVRTRSVPSSLAPAGVLDR